MALPSEITKESARNALNCVLKELRTYRNPGAIIVTIGQWDLEMIIEVLGLIDALWEAENAGTSPF